MCSNYATCYLHGAVRFVGNGTSRQEQVHLNYLDGVRGLAAMYVVIHHAYMEVRTTLGLGTNSLTQSLSGWLLYGGVGVDIFIVLSGFCLMLPVIQHDGKLADGIGGYAYRRARRIIPSYHATMALIMILGLLVPSMRQMQGVRWDLSSKLAMQPALGCSDYSLSDA